MTHTPSPSIKVSVSKPGHHLLVLHTGALRHPFVRVSLETASGRSISALLPSINGLKYVLELKQHENIDLHFLPEEVTSASLVKISTLSSRIRLRSSRDRHHCLYMGNSLSITPYFRSVGAEGKELRKALRFLSAWGFGISSDNLQRTSGLLREYQATSGPRRPQPDAGENPQRFAVVLHLFYRELWHEFSHHLLQIDIPFQLIITTTESDGAFEDEVRSSFPSAEIYVMENRGRDVGPFLELLRKGRLGDYPYVCKLHGKKSGDEGARAVLGTVWRRANILDLIGSPRQVQTIVDKFDNETDTGMIGSQRFRLPNDYQPTDVAWGKNKDETERLALKLGLKSEEIKLDFFAGTMFWIRQSVLESLRTLDAKIEDFPPEPGAVDGDLAHAFDRNAKVYAWKMLRWCWTRQGVVIRSEHRPESV